MLYGHFVRAGDEGCTCGIGELGSKGECRGKDDSGELHSTIESKAARQRVKKRKKEGSSLYPGSASGQYREDQPKEVF